MAFSLLKHKKATGFFLIMVIGVAAIVSIGSIGSSIPSIIFDGYIEDDGPAISGRRIDGHMNYDMTVRYADGSSDKFTKNVQLPNFRLSLASLFADSAKTKEIVGIDVNAKTEFDLPLDKLEGVNDAVLYNGKIDVFLGSNLITSKTFADTFTLAELDTPQDLYTVTITPSQITAISSGTYDLSYKVKDEFTFVVEGTDRVLTIEATPTLYYTDLKPVYAVISSTSIKVELERLPVRDPTFGDVTLYKAYVVITAKGFKANSGIKFDYDVENTGSTSGNIKFYTNAIDKTIISDATGSATDKVLVKEGYSYPKCNSYYGFITISDGASVVGPIKLGCRNIHDDNKGITF